MKTTLNAIREHLPCADGWQKLLAHLGKTKADDAPLLVSTIHASNGLDDALWALRAVDGFDREKRLFAVWCARQVQHLMDDPRSIAALDVAERFANDEASAEELDAAWSAARAAWSAARDAARVAWSAAWSAARAAGSAAWAAGDAWSAAWAAGSAAWSAAWAAGSAAWSAAGDAGSAAWSAAGDAARVAQSTKFLALCAIIESGETVSSTFWSAK